MIIIGVLVVLLFLTQMHDLSFITGLIVGMLTIHIFFHQFSRVLPAEQMPETPTPPRKLMPMPSKRHRPSGGERSCL